MRKELRSVWLTVAVALTLTGCSKSASSPNAADATASGSANSQAQNAPAPAPAPPPPAVVPAGTVLVITLDQTVGTKSSNSGDRFDASLAEPVRVDGQEVIPAHAKAIGTVAQARAAGRVKGGAVLALTLDSVVVNGTKYPVQTAEFEETKKGRGKRTGIGAGGGAAFGAIVGALAGGGKGAAIGALAGGGAGTAGAAFTGQRDIVLPAETRLHFRLTKPLTIQQGP
jgi:hypothetical protein